MEDEGIYQQLHKLVGIVKYDKSVDEILTKLWNTRKTGLNSIDKSHFQSLLNLPSVNELDPVLACLRSLIRKCVRENFTGDDLLKLFPPDLPLDLQSSLVLSLQKYQNQWKDEIARQQHVFPRTSGSYQVNNIAPPSFTSFLPAEMSTPLWPRQDEPIRQFSLYNLGASAPIVSNGTASELAPATTEHDGVIPRLSSMTWIMENRNSTAVNKVAIISLKLQSPSGETEAKFKLTRDMVEALLRSLAYISEQLSRTDETPSTPSQKKQKQ